MLLLQDYWQLVPVSVEQLMMPPDTSKMHMIGWANLDSTFVYSISMFLILINHSIGSVSIGCRVSRLTSLLKAWKRRVSVSLGLVTGIARAAFSWCYHKKYLHWKNTSSYPFDLALSSLVCGLGSRAGTTGTSVCSFYKNMLTHISLQSSTWNMLFRLRPTPCRKPTIWSWMSMVRSGRFSWIFYLEVECSPNRRSMRLSRLVILMGSSSLHVQLVWLGESCYWLLTFLCGFAI